MELIYIFLLFLNLGYAENSLKEINFKEGNIIFDFDSPVDFNYFLLKKYNRIVIEVENVGNKLYSNIFSKPLFDLSTVKIDYFYKRKTKYLRILVDFTNDVPFKITKNENQLLLTYKPSVLFPEIETQTPQNPQPNIDPEVKNISETAESKTEITQSTPTKRDILSELPKSPISIDFVDTDIKDALRILALKAGINIIYGADVVGIISLHLENVPYNEVFNTVFQLANLVPVQITDNIIRAMSYSQYAIEKQKAVTKIKIIPLNYAKADSLMNHLNIIREAEGRKGNISIDERTNSLIIIDTPEGIEQSERIIAQLDRKPPQVLIDAKIVEINVSNAQQLGIKWELAHSLERSKERTVTVGDAKSGDVVKTPWGDMTPVTIKGPMEGGTGVNLPGPPQAGISFGFVGVDTFLTLQLNALQDKGLGKVLSNPRITTLNNQEAKIQVGSQVPYRVTTVTPVGATESISFLPVGIILTVKPVISADKKVILEIRPEVSLVTQFTAGAPQVNTRNAQTTVMIGDGETIVIGGLITDDDLEAVSKVPLLADIPVLGWFFRSAKQSSQRTELLVFVTPKILED